MKRNLLLALIVAIALFLVNDILPSPMGCSARAARRTWLGVGPHTASASMSPV